MDADFSKIDNEKVGYRSTGLGINDYKVLTFKEFIEPYIADTPERVCANLKFALSWAMTVPDSNTGIPAIDLVQVYQRESISKAKELIEENYLK